MARLSFDGFRVNRQVIVVFETGEEVAAVGHLMQAFRHLIPDRVPLAVEIRQRSSGAVLQRPIVATR